MLAGGLLLAGGAAGARIENLQTEFREPVLARRAFGDAGSYELSGGVAHFRFDPHNPANRAVVDLVYAPRNAAGEVEARANWMLLRPTSGRPRALLIEVSNRGSKAALAYFNGGRFENRPRRAADFGDGLLMRQGFAVAWIGWQFDVPPGADRLRIDVPRVSETASPLSGLVRADWRLDSSQNRLYLGHRGHVPYPVADVDDPRNRLSARAGRYGPRRPMARNTWRVNGDYIEHREGFAAGRIYEFVYVSREAAVVGLGLAAVRDFAGHLKHGSALGGGPVLGFGVSQTGRFLRQFLYQGFNVGEEGGRVFDGLLIHAAGAGRGSFNHRFAQPSRDGHRNSTFFYPTDLFPFSGRQQRDPHSGSRAGLLPPDAAHLPLIMYTNTGYEYWGRAASLIHTDPKGTLDIAPLPNERIYHLASTQHFPVPIPMPGEPGQALRGNPIDFLVNLRALLLRLVDWAVQGRKPPPSQYPTLARGSLVPLRDFEFPKLPNITPPKQIHLAHRLDFGPRWAEGIIDNQPPKIGPAFVSLVPQVDGIGHELGGVRNVELRVPIATYTPWFQAPHPVSGEPLLQDFYGSVVPRPDLRRRFIDRSDYLNRATAAGYALAREGFLLEDDVARAVAHAGALWDAFD